MSNSTEKLFDAVSLVADSIVLKYQYDKTIEAKIVSDNKKDLGIYKVEFENAIMDAYSNDSYYKNEIVYVHIPNGDFSKLKHIVGRKVDIEKAPNRTFNLKMPFDDFVGIESLTAQTPYIFGKRGYLANYPKHGNDYKFDQDYVDATALISNTILQCDQLYEADKASITDFYQRFKDILDVDNLRDNFNIKLTYGRRLLNVAGYYESLINSIINQDINTFISVLIDYNNMQGTPPDILAELGQVDYDALMDLINAELKKELLSLTNAYQTARQSYVEQAQAITDQFAEGNYNLLWSWRNNSSTPLVETILGISADFLTLLGSYRPIRGAYGLRIIISGIKRQPEENEPSYVTNEVIWDNSLMYGNTYAYATPYTQQRVLDVSGFLSISAIDIYFYQDDSHIVEDLHDHYLLDNFMDDQKNLIRYDDDWQRLLPKNIFVDNLQVYLGLTTAQCNTDRVIIYTYDSIQYGADPFNPNSRDQVDSRKILVAWIHKMKDGSMVLVNHAKKKNEKDNAALECYDAEIHWYHYDYNIPQDTTKLEEKQGGVNWDYLEDEYIVDTREVSVLINGEPQIRTESYNSYSKFAIDVTPSINKAKEKWKVIVSVGGVPYMSEPLIFYNYDSTVEQAELESVNDVVFRILRETIDEETGARVIREDNSLDSFLVYDENGNCINNDENLRWSLIWFYAQIWIKNSEDGTYSPIALAVDEDNWETESTVIDWLIPGINSMLYNILEPSNADLENAELAPTTSNLSEGFKQVIKNSTRKFQIRDHWNPRYIDNTLSARVVRNGRFYLVQKRFDFGQSGTMGSEYTLAIEQDIPSNSSMIEGEKFRVRAIVYDSRGNKVNNSNFVFSWELLAPTMITYGKNDSIGDYSAEELFELIAHESDNSGNHGNVLSGYIRNDLPPVFRVTVRNAADYPISQTVGFSLVSQEYARDYNFVVNCPNKIEFKSDGKVPITITTPFEITRISENYSKIEHYPWSLNQYIYDYDGYRLLGDDEISFVGLKTTTYQDESIRTNYNPTVYCREVNGKIYYDVGFSLTQQGVYTTAYTYLNLKNAINQDYQTSINSLYESNNVDLDAEASLLETKNNRLNALNRVVESYIPSYTDYSLDPYIDYSAGSSVRWQWDKNLEDSYYTVLQFKVGEGQDNLPYFKQAIPFTRNIYSSSLVNSWNGSLTLDEQNGAVLAIMISAGAKDGKNRFTGVMMGDWADKADDSLDIPGLYGLKYGEQVFGFKTDGTGFIGASGKGRIEFDGNKSLISNSDKTCYINLDPVTYTLDSNNLISSLNNYSGFSQYFLYAQTKKTHTGNYLGTDKLESSTSWAYDYMKDTTNDYFIVDPNNGILTTGGIITKYGKIGNWMISELGLYQKKSDGATYKDNRYMYLGFSSISLEQLTIIDNKYATKYANLENRYNLMIRSALSKFRMEEFKVVGEYKKDIFNVDPMHFFNYGWPVYDIVQALQDTLTWADNNPSYTLTQLVNEFKSRIEHYVYEQTYSGYHRHYKNGVKENSAPYTGGTIVYNHIIQNVSVSNDSYSGDIIAQVADNSRLPEGHHMTCTWTNAINIPSVYIYDNFFGTSGSLGAQSNPPYYTTAQITANAWNSKYSEYGASSARPSKLNTNILNSSHNTVAEYQAMLNWTTAYYNYHLDAYLTQLEMMIEAGLEDLTAEQRADYDRAKAENDRLLALYIKNVVDPIYNSLKQAINTAKNEEIENLLNSSAENRYAIYAGYEYDRNPLFSVNWRGYMTARAGRIGYDSPWYITDYGLTQTNNFGTIFMGNPDAPADKTEWADMINDVDNLTLLPNHNEENSPLVLGASDNNTATRGKFAIYAGNQGYAWIYNETTENYVRSREHSASIKFGVRMDGTLYSTQGLIGGWYITRNMLYSGDPTDSSNVLVLDASRGIINLGNSVILSKDGSVTLGKVQSDGTTAGTINIAGVYFKGRGTSSISYNRYTYSQANGTAVTYILNTISYNKWGFSTTLNSLQVTPHVASTSLSTATLNFTHLLDILNSNSNGTGVTIAIGYEGNNTNAHSVAVFPTTSTSENSTLGVTDHPWDIIGDYIVCNDVNVLTSVNAVSMYMGGEYVATLPWVLDLLTDIYSKLKALAAAIDSMGDVDNSSANAFAKYIKALVLFFNNFKSYALHNGDMTYESGYLRCNKVKFGLTLNEIVVTATSGASGGGVNADITTDTGEGCFIHGGLIPFGGGGNSTVQSYVETNCLTGVRLDLSGTDLTVNGVHGSYSANYGGGGGGWGYLQGDTGGLGSTTISLSHSHDFDFSFSGGVVSLTIGDANFNSATSGPKTFDVAATRWYDDKILSAKVEASTAALNGVYIGFSDGKAIAYAESGTALCSESYPSSSASVSLVKGDSTIPITSGYTIPSSAVGYTISF